MAPLLSILVNGPCSEAKYSGVVVKPALDVSIFTCTWKRVPVFVVDTRDTAQVVAPGIVVPLKIRGRANALAAGATNFPLSLIIPLTTVVSQSTVDIDLGLFELDLQAAEDFLCDAVNVMQSTIVPSPQLVFDSSLIAKIQAPNSLTLAITQSLQFSRFHSGHKQS